MSKELTALNRERTRTRAYMLALQAEVAKAGPARQGTRWLSDREREIEACTERLAMLEAAK